MITTDQLSTNIAQIQHQVAASAMQSGRTDAAVTVMAVTKTVAATLVAQAAAAGITHFGENRVQEARPKVAILPELRWECIGSLQHNKVRAALTLFTRIQSVDSLELARVINRIAAEQERVIPILLQVNGAGETTKRGFSPDAVIAAAYDIMYLPNVRGEGVMTIAPLAQTAEMVRPIFRQLCCLRDQLQHEVAPQWQELSMGMTDDFTVAISEGATLIRLGRAIFGTR